MENVINQENMELNVNKEPAIEVPAAQCETPNVEVFNMPPVKFGDQFKAAMVQNGANALAQVVTATIIGLFVAGGKVIYDIHKDRKEERAARKAAKKAALEAAKNQEPEETENEIVPD